MATGGLLPLSQRKKLGGTKVLIAYVDQADPDVDPEVVPCRYAELVDPARLGRTTSLELELGDFAYSADLAQFNEDLWSQSKETLPRHVNGELEGCYWLELDSQPEGVAGSTDLHDWEMMVGQLAPRTDFRENRFFYTVAGLKDLAKDKLVSADRNLCKLRPSRQYDPPGAGW